MYQIGEKEIEAVAKIIRGKKLFRYGPRSQCARFEERYANYIGVKYARLVTSGTEALRAGLIGLEVGPGDEVIVPAATYMATALAVLAAGAVPVIVDVDESLTLSPKAVEKAIGPCTRALLPVHMWGLPCDMNALMRIARKHNLVVVEDACQAGGGGYRGKKLGSIGHMGCFSFNYYKNISCGEGGAYVTNDDDAERRAQCVNECCGFYWNNERPDEHHFASSGSRMSEILAAIMNVQLGRLDKIIAGTRRQKKQILEGLADTKLKPIKANSLDDECGTDVGFILPTRGAATAFSQRVLNSVIAGQTGRHVFTEWDPVLKQKGGHHPAVDAYCMKENSKCRRNYPADLCASSLDLLNRAVLLKTKPDAKKHETNALIETFRKAAKEVLG